MRYANMNISSLLEQLRVAIDSDFAALGVIRERKLRWSYAAGSMSDRSLLVEQKTTVGLSGAAIRSGRPSMSTEAMTASDRFKLGEPLMLTEQLRVAAALPLHYSERISGILLIGRRYAASYSMEELDAAGRLAIELAERLFNANGIVTLQ